MCTRPRKQIDVVLHRETRSHRSLYNRIILYKNVYLLAKDSGEVVFMSLVITY